MHQIHGLVRFPARDARLSAIPFGDGKAPLHQIDGLVRLGHLVAVVDRV